MTNAPAPTPNRQRPRWGRRVLLGALLLLILAGVALVWAWRLSATPPAWYAPAHAEVPRVAEAAKDIENAVTTQLSLVRDQAPWSVTVSEEDANAWLAARLPQWCRSREITLPGQMSEPSVAFVDGSAMLAATMHAGGSSRVVSLDITPRIGENGALYAAATAARIGRVRAPLDTALSMMGSEKIAAMLRGEAPVTEKPVVTLADGRRVRLLSIVPTSGGLEITCRTESAR
ncbi:MAG: hypothetical protein JSR77_02010 [Planctomycetes bacterium]|nr:hypothetical protein [Planctomycetota bacterium]